MTLRTHAFDYRKCSVLQLRIFIRAKSGQAAQLGLTKAIYIAILQHIDRCMTFRFIDLPPEMRNLIYEHLLEHNSSVKPKKQGFPAILTASRQVYKEARGVLLDQSTMFLRGIFSEAQNGTWAIMKGEAGRIIYEEDAPGKRWRDSWCQKLQNAQNFFIELFFEARVVSTITNHGVQASQRDPMRFMVFSFLTAFRNACPHAKSITVKLVYKSSHSRMSIAKLLRPLRSLPTSCKLKLEGLTEQEEVDFWLLSPVV